LGETLVTKKEIVKTISEEMKLTQLKTKEIVQKTFDAIVETLVTERRIELRNFGVFEVKKRAARKARNPRTGERVDVGEKYVVTFKPGKEMEERVRQLEQAEAEGRPLPPRSPSTPTTSFDDEPDERQETTPPAVSLPSPDMSQERETPGGSQTTGETESSDGPAEDDHRHEPWRAASFARGREEF
jgi:integration host factor subunit beta